MTEVKEGKLELITSKSFPANDDLVRIVDFLNKNLKYKNIMFGITKDKQNNQMSINIYEFQ
ncbi:MAG: YpmA family protein [Syntrophomonas sp.]|nr:YpmA family protein [Syntrophomonas sp.]